MSKWRCFVICLLLLIVSACGQISTTSLVENSTNKNEKTEEKAESKHVTPISDPIFEIQAGNLKISNAWLINAQSGEPTELYVTIENRGSEEELLTDVLINEVLPFTTSVEFYNGEVSDENAFGMIEIPPSEKLELKPGGFMIYLDDTNKDLHVNDVVRIDLHFLNEGDVSIDANVRNK